MGKIMHTLHVHKMVNQWRCRYKQIKEKGFKTAKQKKGEAAKIFTFTCAGGQEKKDRSGYFDTSKMQTLVS